MWHCCVYMPNNHPDALTVSKLSSTLTGVYTFKNCLWNGIYIFILLLLLWWFRIVIRCVHANAINGMLTHFAWNGINCIHPSFHYNPIQPAFKLISCPRRNVAALWNYAVWTICAPAAAHLWFFPVFVIDMCSWNTRNDYRMNDVNIKDLIAEAWDMCLRIYK